MYRRQRATDGGRRSEANLVLGPEEVRLGGGPAWRARGSGSTGPRWQVHRRQTARGVRRPRAARGTACPQRGGRWPGRGTRIAGTSAWDRGRPGARLRHLAGLSPPRRGVGPRGVPGARSPLPPASRPPAPHPPQALVPRLPPLPRLCSSVRAATGEQGRDGRHDPEGRVGRGAEREAGGRQRARAQEGPRARRLHRALSRLGRPRGGRSAQTRRSPAQAPSDWPSMPSRPAPS